MGGELSADHHLPGDSDQMATEDVRALAFTCRVDVSRTRLSGINSTFTPAANVSQLTLETFEQCRYPATWNHRIQTVGL